MEGVCGYVCEKDGRERGGGEEGKTNVCRGASAREKDEGIKGDRRGRQMCAVVRVDATRMREETKEEEDIKCW